MPNVLTVVAPGSEEIETLTVPDVLVRAGCQVTMASGTDELVQIGSRKLPLAAEVPLAQVVEQRFDCVFLPGGLGSARFCQQDPTVQALMARQLAAGRWLALICACPIALLPQGLAKGRNLTCYPTRRGELQSQATWRDQPVVVDRPLVTSQGPGTAMLLGLELAALLCGRDTARSVAKDLLVRWD